MLSAMYLRIAEIIKPGGPGFIYRRFSRSWARLLNLGFLVGDMLADHRVVFPELELVRGGALILGRGVEMPGPGAGDELDLFTC